MFGGGGEHASFSSSTQLLTFTAEVTGLGDALFIYSVSMKEKLNLYLYPVLLHVMMQKNTQHKCPVSMCPPIVTEYCTQLIMLLVFNHVYNKFGSMKST